VTTFASGKIIAAEGTFSVVTRHTALRAGFCVMIQWRRRSNLVSLRHSRSNLVAFGASYFLMLRMVEAYAEGWREFGSARIAA
jgi:hypothetical protein